MRICATYFLIAAAVMFAPSGWAAKIALAPMADAYVQNGLPASLNFGNTKLLKVQTSADANRNFDSFLKFDTGNMPDFSSAILRLYAALSGNGSVVAMLHSVTDTAWGEPTITWNNKPAMGAALISRNVTSKNFEWYEFDVTGYLLSERTAGRNVVTLALHAPSASSHSVEIKSRQAIANKPKLVFTLKSTFTVSLTSPISGATYAAGTPITLSAIAANANGTVTKVEFFAGSHLIGTATQSPHTSVWTSAPSGSHTLTAKATDNLGADTTSSPVDITVTAPTALYFIHPDHLNTPRVITNQAQQVAWRWDNDDPFGANMANENPSGLGNFICNLRFPGQYFDRETNLHYNYYRDYSPEIGRYILSDPVGLRGGLNTYTYVDSNPLIWIDLLGLYQCIYSVSTHTMTCTPNNPANPSFASSNYVAGNNASSSCPEKGCKDNSDAEGVPYYGPLPRGTYNIGSQGDFAGAVSKNARQLAPISVPNMGRRSGFQIHGCIDPNDCSRGCIAATDNNTRDTFNRVMGLEQSNSLTVVK